MTKSYDKSYICHSGLNALKVKSLQDYTNLFSPNEYEKNVKEYWNIFNDWKDSDEEHLLRYLR